MENKIDLCKIKDGRIKVLFAYGSLVSEKEVEMLVGSKRTAIPSKLLGFRREPCVRIEGEEYGMFGAIRDKNSFMNGVLLFLHNEDFLRLDKEEHLYHKENVGIEDIVFYETPDMNLRSALKDIPIRIYVPDAENVRSETKLSPNYRNIVEEAFKKLGSQFYGDFIKTTTLR